MTDDDRPENDARDERVAALLDVEPLDEMTRRRLVARALEHQVVTAPSTRRRWVVGSAAAAVLALVTVTAVVLARDDGTSTTADRSDGVDATTADPEFSEERDAPDAGAPEDEAGATVGAADLGDVSGPERLREALSNRAYPDLAIPPECAAELARLGVEAPRLVATGTLGPGERAYVVIGERAGVTTAFVLRAGGCRLAYHLPV